VVTKPVYIPSHRGRITNRTTEELTDFSTYMSLKNAYTNIHLINFWAGLKEEFPHISKVAVKKLLLFSSAYLCKTAFSRYAATEMKC
jgi:hypothetical protein